MIRAVKYHFDECDWESRFSNPQSKLPVRDKQGQIVLKIWGRRPTDKGRLPLGSIARMAHYQSGRWDAYFPKSVRILVKGFCVADVAGNEHWMMLPKGQFIHGICASYDAELRIYVLSQDSPPEEAEFETWPRIVAAP